MVDVVEGLWGEVTPFMAERTADRAGWVTLEPLFDSDEIPVPQASFLGIFSGRGPAVPDISWVPGERKRERTLPTSVGIRHGSGTRAASRLAAAGHPVPDGWRVVQDHPKRGLVLELAEDPPPEEVLDWSVGAARVLCDVPMTGRWRVEMHDRA